MTATAREYLRVSKGKGRTARSIDRQHTENLTAEQEHGPWSWGEPYRDTGSASKYATRARDDFERLMADLRSGAFGDPGDVLVLWEISRLARETGKGVALIDAVETGGYLIHVTSVERTFNPANYDDRHSLIGGINDAEKESRLLSKRTRSGINSAARDGRPHGRVPLGYSRDYESIDGRPRCVKQYPDSVWGPRIEGLFTRVAGDGGKLPEPIYSIAKDWERRGWWIPEKTENGEVIPSRPFTAQHLRALLVRPVYAGVRIFNGQELPRWEGWTPVVSRELFDRAQAVLADPSRRTYMGGGVRWALSTTLRCDSCEGPMVVSKHRRGLGYECQKGGCSRIPKDETDAFLVGELERVDPENGEPLPPKLGVILTYVAAPHRHAALSRPAGDTSAEEAAVRAELIRLQKELKELEEAPTPQTARARIARTNDMEAFELEITKLEAALRKSDAPNPLAGLLPTDPEADVVSWWTALDVRRQRAIAALLLSPGLLGQVRVMPAPGRVSVPVTERIRWLRDV
ncbi:MULTISPECIES: recombinase family protein [Streptomyces]|nr:MULTISPECIES: recombinase family protein [Streptomyces]